MERGILIEPDLIISGGSIVIGDTKEQNIGYLLLASPGNIYAAPTIGLGLEKYQNSVLSDPRGFINEVTSVLKKDGYRNIALDSEYDVKTNTSSLKVTAEK